MPQIIRNFSEVSGTISSIGLDTTNYTLIPKKRLEYLEYIEKNYSTIISTSVKIYDIIETTRENNIKK